MSEVIHNHMLTYKGRQFKIKPIRRVLAPGSSVERKAVDDYGFRRPNFFLSTGMQRYSGDMLRHGNGGVIVGEGDIGKTWLVEALASEDCDQLHVKALRIRNFEGALRKLIDEANAFWEVCKNDNSTAHLVLDGLDENESAWPIIVEICTHILSVKKCRVWVTGRPCRGMNDLIKSGCLKEQYCLLPFSRDDVRELAEMVGENGEAFLRALINKQVASFATKPGGATLLLKLYGMGKFDTCSRIQLTEEIAKSFARDGRDGVEIPANESIYRDEDLVDCAGWIAARIFFSQRNSLWMGVSAECSDVAFPFADLPHGKYKSDMLNAVTKRRLFEPLSVDRLRVAYDTHLMPFLVAYWIRTHAPKESIGQMLRTDKGIGDGMSEVLKYISLYEPDLGCQWMELSPKSFLDCPKTIELYGAGKYYSLLEKQYLSLAKFDYDAFIKGHAEQLLGQRQLADVAMCRLKDYSCAGRKAELAAMILLHTRVYVKESIDALICYLEKNWLRIDGLERHDLSYTLVNMLENVEYPDVRRLKKLLDDLIVKSEVDEGPKGNLLGLLWPKFLTSEELVPYLCKPVRENFGSSYKSFLNFVLPGSFSESVSRQNILPLLKWASQNAHRDSEHDTCEDLASQIFTYAWKWADDPEIAALMSKCIVAYGKRDGYFSFCMPFYRESMYHEVDWLVSDLQCEKDKKKRFEILTAILQEDGISDDDYENMFGMVQHYGLVYPSEFSDVFSMWKSYFDSRAEPVKTSRLSHVLLQLARWEPLDHSIVERKLLHDVYPNVESFDLDSLVRMSKQRDKYDDKFKAEEEARKRKHDEDCRKHLKMIQDAARTGKLSDSGYFWFAEMVVSDELRRERVLLDITQGCQWSKLIVDEKDRIREFAKEAISKFVPQKTPNLTLAHLFASGVYLLWNDAEKFPQTLSAERWGQIVHYMLSAAVNHDERDSYDEILNWAYIHHQEQSECGAFKAIVECLEEDSPSGLAINNWKKWLSNNVLEKLLEKYGGDEKRVVMILDVAYESQKTKGRMFDAIARYLNKVLSDLTRIPLDGYETLAMAMSLSPQIYPLKVVNLLESQEESVSKWFSHVMGGYHHDHVTSGFLNSDIGVATKFYVWLKHRYPDSEKPVHERCFSPTAKDEIYMLISHLSNRILNEPSDDGLEILERDIYFNKGEMLRELQKGVAERIQAGRRPELVSLSILETLSNEERPLCELSVKEQRRIYREMTKEFATKAEVDEIREEQRGIRAWVLSLVSTLTGRKNDAGRHVKPREERVLNEKKLVDLFRLSAFEMLNMRPEERKKLRKDLSKGKYIAKCTDMREATVGSIIDLKGKMAARGEKPADLPQFFFAICTQDDSYMYFEQILKERNKPSDKLSDEELYRILKSGMERITNEYRERERRMAESRRVK